MPSAVSMLSLISTGMPCSGPRGPLALRSWSSASAIEYASGLSSMTAFTAGPGLSLRGVSTSSMRSRYFSTSERAVNFPDFIPSCNSGIVISSSSNAFTSGGADSTGAATTRPALSAGYSAAVPPAVRAVCRNLRREAEDLDGGIVSWHADRNLGTSRLFKHE